VRELGLRFVKGSPSPGGTERKIQVIVPPMLSFESQHLVIRAFMPAEVTGSRHRVGANECTFSPVILSNNCRNNGFVEEFGCVFVGRKKNLKPTKDVNATISMP
jgi:hypothetical protein